MSGKVAKYTGTAGTVHAGIAHALYPALQALEIML
jgi:hypothetical protein